MQRVRFNRRIVFIIISILVFALAILFDQLTKLYFRNNYIVGERKTVIPSFFYFELTNGNSGAAFGLFSDKAWAQTFFKILTGVALIVLVFAYTYAIKRNYKTLTISICLIAGGTIGNFIDRLFFSKVTDFLTIDINGFCPFAVFNIADACLSIGIVLVIIHLFFLDKNAIFKKNGKNKVKDN